MATLRKNLALVAVSLALAGAGVVACQSYEFEEISPKAIAAVTQNTPIVGVQKPAKLMLVLDKSGSMKTGSEASGWDSSHPGCCESISGGNCSGYTNASCKWNDMKELLVGANGFLDSTKTARVGLAVYPDPKQEQSGCSVGSILVNVPQNAGASVQQIKDALLPTNIKPGGGTPTAPMLRAVSGNSLFNITEEATKRYVVLITDGLPNCNNEPSFQCVECSNGGSASNYCGGSAAEKSSCLDDTATVDAVKELKAKGIDTFVIGWFAQDGGTITTIAKNVLDRAAQEGGQAQVGASTKFYLASSTADLQKILDKIKIAIGSCSFSVSPAPKDEKLLEVKILDKSSNTETVLERGTEWQYANGSVTILGQKCADLQNAAPDTLVLQFNAIDEM